MPRKTPVRELQKEDSGASSPLRRSSRISNNSPVPTKVLSRRNSATETQTSTPIATRSRRSSYSQDSEPATTQELDKKNTKTSTRTRKGSVSSDKEQEVKKPATRRRRSLSSEAEVNDESTKKTTRARSGSITKKDGIADDGKPKPANVDSPRKKSPSTDSLNHVMESIEEANKETDSPVAAEVKMSLMKKKKLETTKIDLDLSVINETSLTEENGAQREETEAVLVMDNHVETVKPDSVPKEETKSSQTDLVAIPEETESSETDVLTKEITPEEESIKSPKVASEPPTDLVISNKVDSTPEEMDKSATNKLTEINGLKSTKPDFELFDSSVSDTSFHLQLSPSILESSRRNETNPNNKENIRPKETPPQFETEPMEVDESDLELSPIKNNKSPIAPLKIDDVEKTLKSAEKIRQEISQFLTEDAKLASAEETFVVPDLIDIKRKSSAEVEELEINRGDSEAVDVMEETPKMIESVSLREQIDESETEETESVEGPLEGPKNVDAESRENETDDAKLTKIDSEECLEDINKTEERVDESDSSMQQECIVRDETENIPEPESEKSVQVDEEIPNIETNTDSPVLGQFEPPPESPFEEIDVVTVVEQPEEDCGETSVLIAPETENLQENGESHKENSGKSELRVEEPEANYMSPVKKQRNQSHASIYSISDDESEKEVEDDLEVPTDREALTETVNTDVKNRSSGEDSVLLITEDELSLSKKRCSLDKTSIVMQENIKAGEDKELNDRIHQVVDLFCSGIKNKGEVAINVSLEYTGHVSDSDDENSAKNDLVEISLRATDVTEEVKLSKKRRISQLSDCDVSRSVFEDQPRSVKRKNKKIKRGQSPLVEDFESVDDEPTKGMRDSALSPNDANRKSSDENKKIKQVEEDRPKKKKKKQKATVSMEYDDAEEKRLPEEGSKRKKKTKTRESDGAGNVLETREETVEQSSEEIEEKRQPEDGSKRKKKKKSKTAVSVEEKRTISNESDDAGNLSETREGTVEEDRQPDGSKRKKKKKTVSETSQPALSIDEKPQWKTEKRTISTESDDAFNVSETLEQSSDESDESDSSMTPALFFESFTEDDNDITWAPSKDNESSHSEVSTDDSCSLDGTSFVEENPLRNGGKTYTIKSAKENVSDASIDCSTQSDNVFVGEAADEGPKMRKKNKKHKLFRLSRYDVSGALAAPEPRPEASEESQKQNKGSKRRRVANKEDTVLFKPTIGASYDDMVVKRFNGGPSSSGASSDWENKLF